MDELIVNLVRAITTVLMVCILVRSLMSFFPASQNSTLATFLFHVTEPILAPLRRIIPRFGMMDITPMIAIFLLIPIQRLVAGAI